MRGPCTECLGEHHADDGVCVTDLRRRLGERTAQFVKASQAMTRAALVLELSIGEGPKQALAIIRDAQR